MKYVYSLRDGYHTIMLLRNMLKHYYAEETFQYCLQDFPVILKQKPVMEEAKKESHLQYLHM